MNIENSKLNIKNRKLKLLSFIATDYVNYEIKKWCLTKSSIFLNKPIIKNGFDTFIHRPFCYIGQCMVGEEKWYLVPSYEDGIVLIRNYETNTATKGWDEKLSLV